MKYSNTFAKIFIGSFLAIVALPAFAGPGALINSPLFVNSNAKPNIMILTDTSGSMRHIVPDDALGADANKYDSTTTYIANCGTATVPDAIEDAGTDNLYIRIIAGRPEISINSRTGAGDPLGTTGGTICFDSNKNYKASLHADGGTFAAGIATARYSGNYLNWYFDFDNTTILWNAWQQRKPDTDYRMNITRATLSTIVDGLDDSVRLGLATLNGGTGATIDEPIQTLTPGFKSTLTTTINGFAHSGTTPMAEALHQVGRYFMGDAGSNDPGNLPVGSTAEANGQTTGTGGNQLTLHPGTAAEVTLDRDTVFPTMATGGGGNVESPIQYWCQNNFVIFMSDGISRSDLNIPVSGNSAETPVIQPTILADYDNDCVGNINCDIDNDQKTTGSYIYDPNGSDYLDDVAQAMFEIDLRPDIDDASGNEALNNVITYTIAFADQDALNNRLMEDAALQAGGQYYASADANQLAADFSAATTGILATSSSAAAVTFNTSTLGNDTAVYQALFNTAFWSGQVNSYPVISDPDPDINGDIKFNCIPDSEANCWNAADHLDALSYDSTAAIPFLDQRQIITFDKTTKKGIAFKAPADFTAPATDEISTAMINDMCAGPGAPLVGGLPCTSATSAAKNASQQFVDQMIDYVRGDRTYELTTNTPTFRTRETVLGDIINAGPIFAGTPDADFSSIDSPANPFGEGDPTLPTGKRYSNFQAAQQSRESILYVAANDGMLHAFRTETGGAAPRNLAGDEIFAYIPSFVFSSQANEGLHHLAEPTYTHKYYVDLTPTYQDYYGYGKDVTQPNFKTLDKNWRTILVGGSRGGVNRGIFALDITNPLDITETTAANKILWEFTNSDDADLGFTYSKPTIVLTHAVGADGPRWAAIFGNGYQNDATAVTNGSSCTAQLFIVFLDGGFDGVWTQGTNPATADYIKIDTQVGATTAGNCNGLSTPRLIDLNGDNITDRVYAGDVQGNMWAFDLTCSGASCGTNDFKIAYSQGNTPRPLFTATDPLGNVQPIMQRPVTAFNNVATNPAAPNLMVMFGTGQYHATQDYIGTTKTNNFYGIWDKGTGNLTDDRTNSASANLVEQVLTTTGNLRQITGNAIDWDLKYGWYINLEPQDAANYAGEERVVVNSAVRDITLFFNSLIPESEVCGFGGAGWLYAVDYQTGGNPRSSVFDTNGDGIVDENDSPGTGFFNIGEKIPGIPADSTFISDYQYTQSSNKEIRKRKICPKQICGANPPGPPDPEVGENVGRQSWRELRADN